MCTQYSPVEGGISHSPRPAGGPSATLVAGGTAGMGQAARQGGGAGRIARESLGGLPPVRGRGHGFNYRRAVPGASRVFSLFPSP